MTQLKDRRIIVTGGASGIGASAVRAFAREGARIVLMDVSVEQGEKVAAEASADSEGQVTFLRCDVADKASVDAAFKDAAGQMGGLDSLVAVAGVEKSAPAESIELSEWERTFSVNARGTFLTNQAAFPFLKDEGGQIINFGSGAGIRGLPGSAHYSAAKGAVLAWTRTIAREWGKYGIRCNAIAPGMWTPMHEAFRAGLSPEQLVAHERSLADRIPLGGTLGNPDRDMAPVLVFLLTEGAGFLTAQTFCVGGGLDITT